MKRIAVLALVAGCYDPDVECLGAHCPTLEPPIGAQLDAGTQDGMPLSADATPSPTDGSLPPPVMTCAPGCTGTCDDGVCVIACIGMTACEDQVVCPTSGPCRVTCNGKHACNAGVRCGLGACNVTCSGPDACKKRVECGSACACDVTCGPGACKEDSVCPAGCDVGKACTSAGSCNDC